MNISKDELKNRVAQEIDNNKDMLINFSKDIAENAETGYRESKTSSKVKEIFKSINLDFTDGHAITGVKSEPIKGKSDGPTIAVIGELDGPFGTAFANLIGDQSKGHSKVVRALGMLQK